MTAGSSVVPEAEIDLPQDIGAPPHAPLAMPKQRLEAGRPAFPSVLGALLRPLSARTGRSRG